MAPMMARLLHFALLLFSSSALLVSTASTTGPNPARPWEAYINSPSTRTVLPQRIHAVSGPANVTTSADDGSFVLTLQPGGQVSLDFGYVGGLLSMMAESNNTSSSPSNSSEPHFSLAFAESPSFVREISDDTGATPTQDYDKALNVTIPASSSTTPYAYTMPKERFRGGFKYLTLHAFRSVTITSIICHLAYSPSQPNPSLWAGHFHTPDDDLLTRIWHAGVFTAQTNIAPPNTSRWLPQVKPGWAYNATLGVEGPMLLDGAKRDRAVWPGDLGIAGTTAYLGLGDAGLESVFFALETMFLYQNASTGQLPFAGPTTGSWRRGAKSDTYHAWTLIACFNYAIFTRDEAWVDGRWGNITAGASYILRAIDASNGIGLAEQVETNDWARFGGGGYNSALNALNYHALSSLASLAADTATDSNDRGEQATTWAAAAAKLKTAYNAVLWDASASQYRDNETAAGALLFPQDGNALALQYNLTTSPAQASSLSAALLRNWNAIGPVTPELPDTISPFISSIEVLAHFTARKPRRGLRLMRRTWGYMLDSPLMTGTTLVEGMSANGSLYYRSQRGYNYDAAYTSLSHSWSTGPTQALSFKVVGLEVVGWGRWRFEPQLGDLRRAEARWRDGKGGEYGAVVVVEGGGDGNDDDDRQGREGVLEAEILTPDGTEGLLAAAMSLPVSMAAPVAEADTTSNIQARACPYTGWYQCINVQTNLCIAQCAWAGKGSAVCLSGCSGKANSACGAYGCGQ
ncbi:bacterial alpha-L-rhamnosidase domain-containing protein [Colletotrichum paranaense]|uniref:Bacterial alpha-L-rhamnosidase domain-containing protein n=1 Tax=Colletotrichum paranaense TaxID=1914294 RepID=A0ABQ9S8C4_9PEZI|nr:bacterial alpha-L-rhamnosidase domain-containing protein [Colletotrichum paranaense]KAK1529510.1 bacterial alpha-L-rhamnosidase domain-containing protein [Colletotrichum paranaense]